MNLILLFPDDFVGKTQVRLSGRRRQHVQEIHRAGVGDRLTVGYLNGLIGRGRVIALDERLLELEVELESPPPPPLPVCLVLALPRPKVLNRVVAMSASLGVKRLYLINSWRVERGYWKSPKLNEEQLYLQMVLGLEQACDTVMPELAIRRFFREFISEDLPRLSRESNVLIAHPEGDSPCPREVSEPVTIVIGPEGGFIQPEIESFQQAGGRIVTLGSRILRVETAIPFLLSRLF